MIVPTMESVRTVFVYAGWDIQVQTVQSKIVQVLVLIVGYSIIIIH